MKKHYIYGLVCPIENKIRYVGQTTNLSKRLGEHIRSSKKRNTHKANWIKKLLKSDLEPEFVIIEECNSNNVNKREIHWISKFKKKKYQLTNSTDGGEGGNGWIPTLKQRKAISERGKGRKHSEKTKRKISNIMLGENSPVRGRIFSSEHKRKLSLASIGKSHSKYTKNKIGNSIRGLNNGMSTSITVFYENGLKRKYSSIKEFIDYSGVCYRTTMKYIDSGIPYKEMILKTTQSL